MVRKVKSIVMLGHKRIPSREGGIEIVVEELATRMVECGLEVTCLNRRGHHVSGKEFDGDVKQRMYLGIHIKRVWTINAKGLAAFSSAFFGAILAGIGPYDVVHFHAEGPCIMLWIPKLFGKRCIATIHGLDWKREKWKKGIGAKIIKLGERVAVHYADEIIVLSEGLKQYFWDKYKRQTHFIPNGVNEAIYEDAQDIWSCFGLESDSYILYLGRLTREKGIEDLIQAYCQLETDKILVIAGGSSDTDDYIEGLKEMASVRDDILFTGFVQGKLLRELYSHAYLFMQPSWLEGMPLGLLEAMSYGCCCLTSDIPECVQVTGKYGISYPCRDIKALSDRLDYLCRHPEVVHEYQKNTANYVRERFQWEEVVRQTMELYEGVLHENFDCAQS